MTHHVTGLTVRCDESGCTKSLTLTNPDGEPFAFLERLAYQAGWYLHSFFGGPDLCPQHHLEHAARVKAKTLYEALPVVDLAQPQPGVGKRKPKKTEETEEPRQPELLPGM